MSTKKDSHETTNDATNDADETMDTNNGAFNEYLTSLEKNYPTLDHIFLEKRARAIADARSEFEIDGKVFYFVQDKFVSADKNKAASWSEDKLSL